MTLKLGIVVGEVSGDNLAAECVRAIKKRYPDISIVGMLGPELLKEGGHSLYPMERFSVMGFFEPLARLPELLRARNKIIEYFIKNPPDVFIGVDSPDTNLGIEKKLKEKGIPTIHYVSPSVWAWRQGRIHLIKSAVDLMLTLLPFEADFYKKHQIPVQFVGHPLADKIPLITDPIIAKQELNVSPNQKLIALMPGSRNTEIKYLAEPFILAAKYCFQKDPTLQFVVPLVKEQHKQQFEALKQKLALEVPITVTIGNTYTALSAADAVLVTSGTATLEVMLHKKPMVIAYRMHPLTYLIAKRLVKVRYIGLPNLLANEPLVPEYIQDAVKPEILGNALLNYFSPQFDKTVLVERFNSLHKVLKQNGSELAAEAILERVSIPS